MKPEQLFQHLKDLFEKLNIIVSEENLRKSGVRIKSGFCRVKNKDMFILDKHKSVYEKNIILATFLGKVRHDDIYMMPAVRDFVSSYAEDQNEFSKKDDIPNEKGC